MLHQPAGWRLRLLSWRRCGQHEVVHDGRLFRHIILPAAVLVDGIGEQQLNDSPSAPMQLEWHAGLAAEIPSTHPCRLRAADRHKASLHCVLDSRRCRRCRPLEQLD